MADTLQFDLVSPERRLVSTAASRVQIPAMDGDMTAMPNHAPFLTTLRPGVVRVTDASGEQEFVVTGGFAEITPTAASILAERAVPRGEASAEMVAELQSEADATLADAPEADRLTAGQRARDVGALRSQLGL